MDRTLFRTTAMAGLLLALAGSARKCRPGSPWRNGRPVPPHERLACRPFRRLRRSSHARGRRADRRPARLPRSGLRWPGLRGVTGLRRATRLRGANATLSRATPDRATANPKAAAMRRGIRVRRSIRLRVKVTLRGWPTGRAPMAQRVAFLRRAVSASPAFGRLAATAMATRVAMVTATAPPASSRAMQRAVPMAAMATAAGTTRA